MHTLQTLLATQEYAELSDSDAAALANEKRHAVIRPTMLTERGIIQAFANPTDGDAALAALESFAETEHPMASIIRRVLTWLKPTNEGIDVGDATVRAMIDQLVSGGVLTETQGDTIKTAAEGLESDAQQNGLGTVGVEQVKRARMDMGVA